MTAWAGLSVATLVFGADTLPYRVTIPPTGDRTIDQAMADASLLAQLKDQVPVGPFALIARAESDIGRIDTTLRSFGYYDAGIQVRIAGTAIDDPRLLLLLESLPPMSEVLVEVSVIPGPLYRLGIVRLDGPVPADARAAFRLAPGEPARAQDILDAGAAVLLSLQEDGFALARVPPPDAVVDHDTRTMDIVYHAEPGQRLAIGEVRVIGLERLRESAVLRRLGLNPGEPFSPSRLEAARRDLLAGGVLAWARLTPVDAPDAQGRLPLTLELAERPRRVIRLAGSFSSDEGLTVSASWTHRNLLGGGERLTLTGDVGQIGGTDINALSYLTNASLMLPDLWVRDLDLRLDLGAVNEDLDAYDREAVTAGLTFERRLAPGLSAGAGVAFERSRVSQDGPPRDYRLVSAPLALGYDSTDSPLDPLRGLRLAAQMTPTRVLEGEESGFVRTRLVGSAYLDLGAEAALPKGSGRLVLAGRLVIGSIVGAAAGDVPPDWRFYAGGGGSVRGYPFQSIGPRTVSGSPAGGDGLLEGSLELRQRINANWGGVAFIDAGSVSRESMPSADGLAVGVGVGLRYFTPIGPVRADIATPLDRNIGGSAVQVYIGIGQAF